jgi:hypothetical protein
LKSRVLDNQCDATFPSLLEISPMHRILSRAIFTSVLVTALAFMTFALPASASGKSVVFCKDADGVAVVATPTLPSNDSLGAIATAVAKLPSDVMTLKKIHQKLQAAVSVAPSTTLAGVYRDAATSVMKEMTALTAASDEEAALLTNPKSSAVVMALAKDLIAAFSAAAAANTYLTVDRSIVDAACR